VAGSLLGWILGRRRIAVLDLTVQRPGSPPQMQASGSGTVANRISGQFVNGQDHVFGPVFRQPCPTGMALYARSQRVERARIEHQIQSRGDWLGYWVVIGHSLRQASPRLRTGRPAASRSAGRPAC
jgi:hypothetical protein